LSALGFSLCAKSGHSRSFDQLIGEQGSEMMSRFPSCWLQIGRRQSNCACGGSDALVHSRPRRLMARHGPGQALFCQNRKDGEVVKEGDDLMCATRYGLMSLRFANTKASHDRWRRPIEYPNLGIV